jgi:hypothetical protein
LNWVRSKQRWIRQFDWLSIICLTNKNRQQPTVLTGILIGHISVFLFSFSDSEFNFKLSILFRCKVKILDICFAKLTWVFETQVWAIWPWRFDRKISHLNPLSLAGFLSLLLLVRIFINFTFCNVAKFVCLWRKIFSWKWDKQDHPIRCLLVVFKIQLHQLCNLDKQDGFTNIQCADFYVQKLFDYFSVPINA